MSVVGFIVHDGRAAAVDAAAALGAALGNDGVTVVQARDPGGAAATDLIVTIGETGRSCEEPTSPRNWTAQCWG